MSNIQKQHKISPAIAWLTIQKFIIFYCPLDGEHTMDHTEFFLHIWKNLSVTGLADNFGFSDIAVDHVCRFV